MAFTKKAGWGNKVLAFMAGLMGVLLLGYAAGNAADLAPGTAVPLDTSRNALRVIRSSPLVAGGVELGMAFLYDDPSTSRAADYLELYDGEGGLIALSWFDRFGIQRIAVDRSFVDGAKRLEGVFVAVVDDSFI